MHAKVRKEENLTYHNGYKDYFKCDQIQIYYYFYGSLKINTTINNSCLQI